MNYREVDLARLAAFIDGEGTIRIATHSDKKGHIAFYSDITVVNCDPRMTDWLKATFGGSVAFVPAKKKNHQDQFRWNIACKQATEIIRACRAYFVCKGDQADILLAFAETLRRAGVKGHPPEMFQRRAQLHEALKSLHGGASSSRKNRVIEAAKSGQMRTTPTLSHKKGESATVN